MHPEGQARLAYGVGVTPVEALAATPAGQILPIPAASRMDLANRTGIGFAGFLRLAPPETFSGSLRDRKSRAHAPVLRDSRTIPLCGGLDGGGEFELFGVDPPMKARSQDS